MVTCRACKTTWRVEAGTDVREFKYRHADVCADLLDRIAVHLVKLGIERWIRRRVQIIGISFTAAPIVHRRRQGRELTVCDHRCRSAKGPDCDCKCMGALHGVAHSR